MTPDDSQKERVENYLHSWTASYLQYGRAWTPQRREESRRAVIERIKQMTKGWDERSRQCVSIPADPFAR